MLATKEELRDRYASFTDEKLMSVLYNRGEYTAEALDVAQAELDKRKVATEHIRQFIAEKEKEKIENERIALIRAHVPLTFPQKAFYFFAWFAPGFIAGAFQMNDDEDGYVRRVRQSRNFRIAGVLSLLAVAFIGLWLDHGTLTSLVLLLGLFIAFFLVDDKLNAARK